MDVFFYGLNMDHDHLVAQGVEPSHPRVALIVDHEVRLGAKAFLVSAEGSTAFGMLFRLTHDDLGQLYGSKPDYVPRPVLAMVAGGERVAALTMVHRSAPRDTPEDAAYASHWRAIVAGLDFSSLQGSRPLPWPQRTPTVHQGACHCGSVRFRIETDFPELTMCDCSICRRKNALMVKVHESKFWLLSGQDCLSEYQFHTRTARHYFCRVCGIYPFHRKRVTPDHFGVNVHCLDGFDPAGIPVRQAVGAAMA